MRVRILLLMALLLSCVGCGPKLPPRYVIERDLDSYKFRRYQQVLDVEFQLPDNPAVGHTATYVRGGQTVRVAPVFITVYDKPAGLTEAIRQRLRSMDGYTFDVTDSAGANLFRMRGEGQDGDVWLLWVSGQHVVKLGAPEGEKAVPEPLIEAYLQRYPSDLDDQGKARDDTTSAGTATTTTEGAADAN